jgi:hypothetical protein
VAIFAVRTTEQLTVLLVERVMGWVVTPDRFLTGKRRWIPRWRFTPLTRLEHAFQLLDLAAGGYTLTAVAGGIFTAEVRIHGRVGRATGLSKAKTISLALAQALEPELPDEVGVPASVSGRRRNPRSGSKNDGV